TPSELEAHAELNVPAIVGLGGDPPKARSRRIRIPQTAGQRIALRAGLIAGPAQVRMVQEIEDLGPELQLPRSAQAEVLEDRDVPLLLAGVVDQVARRVAERARRRRREGGRVEPEIVVAPVGELLVRIRVRIADEVVRLAEPAV